MMGSTCIYRTLMMFDYRMGWVLSWAPAWAPAWAMSRPGPKTGLRGLLKIGY